MENNLNRKKSDISIPASTPSRIVIPSKEQSYTFEKNTYREDYLKHCIGKSEYDSIISKASRVLGQSWADKRLNDQIKLPNFVLILGILAVVFIIIYLITLYLSASSSNGTALFVVSIICVCIGSAIAFGLSIYNFFREIGKFKSLDEIIKNNMETYLDGINRRYEGYLLFIFNSEKRWIECNILKPNDERKYYAKEYVKEAPEGEEEDMRMGKNTHKKSASKVHSRNPSNNIELITLNKFKDKEL
jgi:hypothetical protein